MTPNDIAALPYRPCAGVMLVNAAGHVFVGQRLDSDTSAWQMPQGGIEAGENPTDAAFRELLEETGITGKLVNIEAELPNWVTYELPHELVPKLWKGRFRGQKQRWFLMRFHGTDDQVNIATEQAEFSAWKWLHPDRLVDSIVPFKRDVYATVVAGFADHLQ